MSLVWVLVVQMVRTEPYNASVPLLGFSCASKNNLLFFNPLIEGIGEGKTRKKLKAQTLALRMTNLEQYLS